MTPRQGKYHTGPKYELLYHPEIPGRGEYVRLVFEATGTPYIDVSNQGKAGYKKVEQTITEANPPAFAPPALLIHYEGHDGGSSVVISQTPNILLYLGPKLGLVPEGDETALYYVNGLALTALDMCNEAHDVHHPIDVEKYYEEQKPEAMKKSYAFRKKRIPKFFAYFETVLTKNTEGDGKYLVGNRLTYADTTLWQVLEGIDFAFPNTIRKISKNYPVLLSKFRENIKDQKGISEYISSGRRRPFSIGVFRHYPELDV
ncbi:glutathione S-transferase [Lipomyces kononenkoae]|uniref:Glutathione S-transferase n=1 Tax=Lipomyces kononenkoae TaxID=34357 RepID=A0ACC3SYI0_LIPKO